MGKDWDYSELTHNAKLNGGPEKYLEAIRDCGIAKGKLEGKAEGKAELLIAEGIALGIGLLGYAGYKAFTNIKNKQDRENLKEQELRAEEAKRRMMEEINNVIAEESEDSKELEDD